MGFRGSLVVAVFVLLAACGGSVSPTPPSDAASEAPPGDADATACVNVTQQGSPCTAGQVSCDRVDPCCAQTFSCDSTTKTWTLGGLDCFACLTHSCGNLTCSGDEMCVIQGSGVDGGGSSYQCAPYPAACARQWTCGCVEQNLPAGCILPPSGGCTDTSFPVTLTCMGA